MEKYTKYIRTKDGIFEYDKHISIEGDTLYEIVFDDKYTDYGVNGKYSRGKIIAKADTIEELCDVFVMISEDYDLPQLVCKMNFEYCKTICKWTNFYGAVWTNKGLIYVAKMNEKGELELL